MYEMVYHGQPILVYDVKTAIKEGLIFKKKSLTIYKDVEDDTMIKLELNNRIQYMLLLDYLEHGWKIL
jgi:hypothetical protein